jgi:hypothetical protein
MSKASTSKEARMARTTRINIDGHVVRSASQRRFVVIAVRKSDVFVAVEVEERRVIGASHDRDEATQMAVEHANRTGTKCGVETFVAFARIDRRSDSAEVARTAARRAQQRGDAGRGVRFAVVDSTTGEEI